MIPSPPVELSQWIDILAKVGQFLFGLATLVLAIWAVLAKRKDIFRSELVKKQIEELGKIRSDLQSIFFDIHFLGFVELTIRSNPGWNLENIKENDNESWILYQRYKQTSIDLFYKFSDEDYYLFPEWIDLNRRKEFGKRMREFAPFSLNAVISRSTEDREQYQLSIAEMKTYIDKQLRKYA